LPTGRLAHRPGGRSRSRGGTAPARRSHVRRAGATSQRGDDRNPAGVDAGAGFPCPPSAARAPGGPRRRVRVGLRRRVRVGLRCWC